MASCGNVFFGRILEFSSLITHQIYLRFASLIYLFFVNCSFNLLMLSCILFIFLLTLFFVKFDCNLGLISYICGLFCNWVVLDLEVP